MINGMKIKKIGLYEILLVCTLFLFSLEDHGEFRIYLASFLLMTAYLFRGQLLIHKQVIRSAILFLSFLIGLSALSKIGFFSYRSNMAGYSEIDFLFSTSIKVLISLVFLNLTLKDKDKLLRIVSIVLIIHLSIFYIQLFVVYVTGGYYIDLLSPFTGEKARYTWGVTVPFIGATFRPTGMYNEPSTYSAYILCIFLLRYLLLNKLDKISHITILSFFLSLSFASIFYAFLIIFIFNMNKNGLVKYFPIVFLLSLALSPLLISMLEARMSGNYDAVGIRTGFFDMIFNQSIEEIVFGNGPIGVPYDIEGIVNSESQSWAKNGLPALNDNGLIVFILMKFGLLGCISLIIFLRFKFSNNRNFLLNCILLITKIKYTSVIFILYLSFVYLINRTKSATSSRTTVLASSSVEE
ncbi:hypothetical protein [Aeromonas caviae]|uniref:hypothetical protein n=1 Tax=Aeromonas caviae TaxID=648 RepID=UPI002B46A32B|nr:hypothetical protein [Aeromonas caviae]